MSFSIKNDGRNVICFTSRGAKVHPLIQSYAQTFADLGWNVSLIRANESLVPSDSKGIRYKSGTNPRIVNIRPKTIPPVILNEQIQPQFVETLRGWNQYDPHWSPDVYLQCIKNPAHWFVVTDHMDLIPVITAATHLGSRVIFQPMTQPEGRKNPEFLEFLHQLPKGLRSFIDIRVQHLSLSSSDGIPSLRSLTHATDIIVNDTGSSTEQMDHLIPEHFVERIEPILRRHLRKPCNHGKRPSAFERNPTIPNNRAVVTIAIPTWNRCHYLEEALYSIRDQAEHDALNEYLEILVSDNGSDDDTRQIVEDFCRITDIPVVYHRNPENLGMRHNFLQALDRATGTYTILLGDDDILIEGSLRAVVECLATQDPAIIVSFALPDSLTQSSASPDSTSLDNASLLKRPRRLTVEEAAQSYFYHIGNIGLAASHTDSIQRVLRRSQEEQLQEWWPQTQLYFTALGEAEEKRPFLETHLCLGYGPSHTVVNTYTAAYLWSAGMFGLLHAAINVSKELGPEFLDTVVEHCFKRMMNNALNEITNKYATTDSQENRMKCLRMMTRDLNLLVENFAHLGKHRSEIIGDLLKGVIQYGMNVRSENILDEVSTVLHKIQKMVAVQPDRLPHGNQP